ncbi:transposase [Mycolicibacterium smegmatis]|nr:transposase [Mycolicibacterium smegmatis]
MHRSTATRRAKPAPAPADRAPRPVPVNKLTESECARVVEVLNSARFVDAAPMQVWATLLDEGSYLCSVSTMYRVLNANKLVKERRRLARHRKAVCPELVATAPRQVYSWDITKLAGPVKGVYYDAYVMIDIYSRYIVGVHVHARECGQLAKEMMEQIFGTYGIPHVVHADRGTSMTSNTVAGLLSDLGVIRSHSRPKVSNDNPYSEHAVHPAALCRGVAWTPSGKTAVDRVRRAGRGTRGCPRRRSHPASTVRRRVPTTRRQPADHLRRDRHCHVAGTDRCSVGRRGPPTRAGPTPRHRRDPHRRRRIGSSHRRGLDCRPLSATIGGSLPRHRGRRLRRSRSSPPGLRSRWRRLGVASVPGRIWLPAAGRCRRRSRGWCRPAPPSWS